jgi:malate dehydrogenase (oxaloacetate-decarboxylating)(NADP+)
MKGADVFIGLSVGELRDAGDAAGDGAERPIVFALANPDPEIPYDVAVAARRT